MVEDGGAEAAAHPVPVDLDHVEPRLKGQLRRCAEALGDLPDFLLGEVRDIGPHLLVEKGAQRLLGDPPGQHAGEVFSHGPDIGVGLVELGAEEAALPVDGVGQGAVEGPALLRVEGGDKGVGQHRHVADDDHGAAPRGDPPQPGGQVLPPEAHGGGGEDHPVL